MKLVLKFLFTVSLSCVSLAAFADREMPDLKPTPLKRVTVEPKYEWNANTIAKIDALNLKGEVNHGRVVYIENCMRCHQANGGGEQNGTYPQLAGQHSTVLIKQISDIKHGIRTNPKMEPHVTVSTSQDLADVTAYINLLSVPHNNGKNTRNPGLFKKGEALYKKDCVSCHGASGEGNEKKLFPVLAGQHYKYLLRQMRDIRSGARKNSLPAMVTLVKKYSDEELDAVASYSASLKMADHPFPSGK